MPRLSTPLKLEAKKRAHACVRALDSTVSSIMPLTILPGVSLLESRGRYRNLHLLYDTMSELPVSKPTCPIPSRYGMQHVPPMLQCCAGEMSVVPASIAVMSHMARTFTSSPHTAQ